MRARKLLSVLPTLNLLVLSILLMIKMIVAVMNMEAISPDLLFLEGYLAVIWTIFTIMIYGRV